jgi:signal transduction histidine kinase
VTLLTLGLFLLSAARWHEWAGVRYGLSAFAFALLFTLVFTLLIVSAEKARNQVQGLAAELRAANLKLREYAVQAEELAVTRERNRLAREIHDSLGHYLTVVNVQIQAAQAVQRSDPARASAALDKARALTQEGLREIRGSIATLRASPLDNRLLAEALAEVVEEHRTAGLNCQLTVLGSPRPLAPAVGLTLYRAGQEGLTNVQKHARAKQAGLVIDFRSPETVSLRVVDDGVGTVAGVDAPTGFGLLGLRERCQLLGGRVRVTGAPGAGFTLDVEVPG